jgi:hypothetical protein
MSFGTWCGVNYSTITDISEHPASSGSKQSKHPVTPYTYTMLNNEKYIYVCTSGLHWTPAVTTYEQNNRTIWMLQNLTINYTQQTVRSTKQISEEHCESTNSQLHKTVQLKCITSWANYIYICRMWQLETPKSTKGTNNTIQVTYYLKILCSTLLYCQMTQTACTVRLGTGDACMNMAVSVMWTWHKYNVNMALSVMWTWQ